MNLDRAIIDTVLALQNHTDDGVSFDSIRNGVAELMGAQAAITPQAIYAKVEHLLGYEGMLHRTDSGHYVTPDLDALSFGVGIPDENPLNWFFDKEDLDSYVLFADVDGGRVVDIHDAFDETTLGLPDKDPGGQAKPSSQEEQFED